MPTQRDLRIDTLRGLAIVSMTVAHVNLTGIANVYPVFGYVGAAEPFVILSGLVAGSIYYRMALRRSAAEVWNKGLRRTGFVYLNYLGLALGIIALTLLFQRFDPSFKIYRGELISENPWRAVLLTPFFLYMPGYADILPMYVAFMALTPFVVLRAKDGRLGSVMALSAFLWLLAQFGLGDRLLEPLVTRLGSHLGYFDVLGWQLVFVTGLVLGIRSAQGKDAVPRSPWLFGLGLVLVVLCYATAHGAFGAPRQRYGLGWIEDRSSFAPLRVINTGAWILVLARVGELRTHWLEWRWLAFLGAHSMIVFVYSCFLGYFLTPFDDSTPAVKVTAVAIGLVTLTIPAWLQQRWRARSLSRAPHSAPTLAHREGPA